MNSTNPNYDFISTFMIGKEQYKEIHSLRYKRFFRNNILICFSYILFSNSQSVSNNHFICALFMLIWLLGLWVSFCLVTHNENKHSTKQILAQGQDLIPYTVGFSEKITVRGEKENCLEYSYSDIEALKESDTFYWLVLKSRFYIPVKKGTEAENVVFCEYIKNKNHVVSKKRVENISKFKTYYILSLAISTILIILWGLSCVLW